MISRDEGNVYCFDPSNEQKFIEVAQLGENEYFEAREKEGEDFTSKERFGKIFSSSED